MNRKSLHVFSILFAIAMVSLPLASQANAANLLVNGSFEEGDYSGANFSWKRLFAGNTSLTGWTVGGVGVDWHNSAEMNFPQDGGRVLDLNLQGTGSGTGTLSQSFPTIAAQEYVLSFYVTNPGQIPVDTLLLNVNLDGDNYSYAVNPSFHTSLQWELNTINFIADTNLTTLTFSSLYGETYWGPVLDNVSVEARGIAPTPAPAVVPEPASMLLLGSGLAGFFLRRRTS